MQVYKEYYICATCQSLFFDMAQLANISFLHDMAQLANLYFSTVDLFVHVPDSNLIAINKPAKLPVQGYAFWRGLLLHICLSHGLSLSFDCYGCNILVHGRMCLRCLQFSNTFLVFNTEVPEFTVRWILFCHYLRIFQIHKTSSTANIFRVSFYFSVYGLYFPFM